ncbi:MAG: glutamate-1-semialdehyde 2,1-aminomutase [Pseudomonadota bacterium]
MSVTNESLFERAKQTNPGGVNSPVRSFRSVGGTPRFFRKGEGAYLWDVEGTRYLDLVGSWGASITGHAHPEIVQAVQKAAEHGLSFGAPTEAEIEMAETLCRLLPSMEQVRLVSSGTEATMSAIRLARGFTKRDLLIKFEGCYHGHSDSLLVAAGSGALTFGHPTSGGVSELTASQTVVLPYHDTEALENAFKQLGDKVAAVIIEPVAGNMNMIIPTQAYLQTLRTLCDDYGVVLIFDEVMSGFRVALECVQGLMGIRPDITTLGKVIGGGMPVAAFGGRKDIMAHLAPLGSVYQAGTLSGNPVAVAAGLASLAIIQREGFYQHLSTVTQRFVQGINRIAANHAFCAQSLGGMFGFYCLESVPDSYEAMRKCDQESFKRVFHALLNQGVYLPPSAFEAGFMSAAHTEVMIDDALNKFATIVDA